MSATQTNEPLAVREEIRIAAAWWASKLRTTLRPDCGDLFLNASMDTVKSAESMPEPVPESRILIFESSLAATLEEDWHDHDGIDVSVDYDPDMYLQSACATAGIDVKFCQTFPIKTIMLLRPGIVEVSEGYGAPSVVLFGQQQERNDA